MEKTKPPKHIVILFIDGVGFGKKDPEVNPFFCARLPQFRKLCGGRIFHQRHRRFSSKEAMLIPVDATLGMPGLPQSGTGQTAIFTGTNGAKIFGRHFGPYPPSVLRPVIQSGNIFKRVRDLGGSAVYANAFPKEFLQYASTGTRRLTVSTLSCILSGIPLLTARDLMDNNGISADFIRTQWPELGHPDVRSITAFEAGLHFYRISMCHTLTVFEYWLTDHAGHSRNMKFAVEVLEQLDEFLAGYFEQFDESQSLFLMISDHGNIEDLSLKSHTRNKVPCILAGREKGTVASQIRNLTDITPALIQLLS